MEKARHEFHELALKEKNIQRIVRSPERQGERRGKTEKLSRRFALPGQKEDKDKCRLRNLKI